MATEISWTDETWNPIVGCSRVSPGCANCYAAEAAKSPRLQQFEQYKAVKSWNGATSFVYSQIEKPLNWRKPKKIFVCSMSDLFHENTPNAWIDEVFAIMAICRQHTFQILTKRPQRMLEYFSDPKLLERIEEAGYNHTHNMDCLNNWPLPNIWVGTTCEDQQRVDERIPILDQVPATIRFLSCEPLLEKIDLKPYLTSNQIQWVIVGGESGKGARPCNIQWIESIIDQCQQAEVSCFVKQLGSKAIAETPLKPKGKGGDIELFPEPLKLRHFPV